MMILRDKDESDKCNAIVDALCYWLGYQFKIGRERLIHEASLRYPIADTLTAGKALIKDIVLELSHPAFISKLIDLVVYDPGLKATDAADDATLTEAYEFKLAKKATSEKEGNEHQRVFNDVVRLAYYNQWRGKTCYFLMCGKYADFKTYFVGQAMPAVTQLDGKVQVKTTDKKAEAQWDPEGLYKDWFAFQPNKQKSITFHNNAALKGAWGLQKFQETYIPRDATNKFLDTITVKTTCMAITAAGLETSRTHAAGIWKIEGF